MMGKNDLRPAEFPRLEHYEPSGFMLPTSHYDAKKADRAVAFIENLRHTKGKWAGKRFWLLPWQEQIIRDVFGIVKENGKRQFLTAYVEIPKKNGKSELAAAVALYLLYGDNEPSAEVYGCAADRQQASIVYDVAKQMIAQSPALEKRSKVIDSVKRVVNYSNAGFYQVLSAEVGTKHGLNVSGLVFDELHAQPNRKLWDVMTKGSGDAREQPLFFAITTAGNDRNSVCWEQHQLALDILHGRKADPTYYPVVYGLPDDADWNDEKNWYKANPSLGHTIQIDRVRNLYRQALDNPADENNFKQLRLNMWTSSTVGWIPEHVFDWGSTPIDMAALKGRTCYAGLDLSSTTDITAFVLVFPPQEGLDRWVALPTGWMPLDGIDAREREDHVPYRDWIRAGFLHGCEGDIIDFEAVADTVVQAAQDYDLRMVGFDPYLGATVMQNIRERLAGTVTEVVEIPQGIRSISPPMKELERLIRAHEMLHVHNTAARQCFLNLRCVSDDNENIKPTKKRSRGRIDITVAWIIAFATAMLQPAPTLADSVAAADWHM